MVREEEELKAAKRGHRLADPEEAGGVRGGPPLDLHRAIDYEVSEKHLPTCQALGDVYLRLDRFAEALVYQEKHSKLAKDSNDLIEQQRASTQLGRTYHGMLLRSENDHYAIRNANKYFKLSMKFARELKDNPPNGGSSLYLKEFIDAHNNIGMLELDLDNLDDAEKFLLQALKLCDDEEVAEDDDGRSRLNHNLGSVYLELRERDKATQHIGKDQCSQGARWGASRRRP